MHVCFFHDSSFVDKQFDSCMAVFPSGINANANLTIKNLRIKYYLYGASYEFSMKPPTCTSYTLDSLQNVEITMICEDNKGKILHIIMLSVIFSLYIRYTTILAYCTDIRVISLIHVYGAPRVGIEPGAS